jgi:type VI secretion system protein ImpB
MPGFQSKFEVLRPPRVQLKYELQTGDTVEQRQLPFVVGVLGDYTGKRDTEKPYTKFKDRKFVTIDRDNFDKVMSGFDGRLALSVADKISGNRDQKLNIVLEIREMNDFTPESIVQQVEPLRKLLETRHQLAALKSKLPGNRELTGLLEQVLNNQELQQKLGTST